MSYTAILICTALGVLFVYNYFHAKDLNRMIEKWPVTQGTIIEKKFFPGGNRTAPRLMVNYEFYVNGKRYQSDRIYVNHWEYGVRSAEEIEGLGFIRNPEVKYNPEKPDQCCLILYPNTWVYTFLMWLGVFLFVVAVLGLLFRFLK